MVMLQKERNNMFTNHIQKNNDNDNNDNVSVKSYKTFNSNFSQLFQKLNGWIKHGLKGNGNSMVCP